MEQCVLDEPVLIPLASAAHLDHAPGQAFSERIRLPVGDRGVVASPVTASTSQGANVSSDPGLATVGACAR